MERPGPRGGVEVNPVNPLIRQNSGLNVAKCVDFVPYLRTLSSTSVLCPLPPYFVLYLRTLSSTSILCPLPPYFVPFLHTLSYPLQQSNNHVSIAFQSCRSSGFLNKLLSFVFMSMLYLQRISSSAFDALRTQSLTSDRGIAPRFEPP